MALVTLLRFENSGTTITDEVAGNVWTASGGATQSTVSPITGLSSLDLTSAEGGVSTTTAAVINNCAGARDWRADIRVKGTTAPPWFYTALFGSNVWNMNIRNFNELDFEGVNSGNAGGFERDGASHLVTVSFVNSTQRVYIFLDGTLVANVAYGAGFSVPSVLWVGKSTGASTGWRGKLDEFRYLINESVTASFVDDGLPFAGPVTGSTATAAAGVATVSASGAARAAAGGTAAAGVATVSASARATTKTTATSASGVATVSASGSAKSATSITAAAGAATVSAGAVSTALATGSAPGVASVAGSGSSLAATTATAAAGTATVSAASLGGAGSTASAASGVATVAAVGSSKAVTAGQANGLATVAAVGASAFRATAGSAAGVSTTAATGRSAAASTPSAAVGAATVSAIGSSLAGSIATAVAAAGSSAVSAIAASLARASGLAQGMATASATSSGFTPTVLGSLIGRTRHAFGIRSSVQTSTRRNEQRSKR